MKKESKEQGAELGKLLVSIVQQCNSQPSFHLAYDNSLQSGKD